MDSANKRLGQLFSRILEGASIEAGEATAPGGVTRILATGQFGNASIRVLWAGAGWPADIRQALDEVPTGTWPRDLVIAAQRISPGALALLEERDANWVDEAGSARIVGPGLLVIREALPAESVSQAFAWSPSALAIAEALLARSWSSGIGTTELATLVQWSAPQVSQVLHAFDEQGWTVKYGPQRGRGARRELIDAAGLLNAWASFLNGQERDRRLTHRTLRSPLGFLESELVEALDSEVRWALSGWAAAHELAPIADTVPSLQIYVHEDDFDRHLNRAIKMARLSDVAEGGRVAFFPAHPSVLALAQSSSLAPIVSSPRVYADLLAMGGRGVDAAEHLKDEVLDRIHPPLGRREAPAGMVNWEHECRGRLRHLTADRPDLWALYARGTWSASYRLLGVPEAPEPRRFTAILREVAGHETGWPPWWIPAAGHDGPRPVGNMVECWLSDMLPGDPAKADFWRADPQGRLCLIRGYQEDAAEERLTAEPQTRLDLVLPIWNTGECLLHCERLARRLDATSIQVMMRWTGLEGRRLASMAGRSQAMPMHFTATATRDEVVSFVEVTAAEIEAELTGTVRRLVDPLYASFDFFEPPARIYDEELAAMRAGANRW